jgi:hypothetical protein
MEEIVLNWRGAFKFHTPIPSNLNAAVGLYLLEYNSRILYVGKAKDQGGFKRAKDHLRGYMDSTGRCAIEEAGVKSKDEINLWIGWIEEDRALSLIDDAEKLLTFDRDPPCNKTNRGAYEGRPLHIKNIGSYPSSMPSEIRSPSTC